MAAKPKKSYPLRIGADVMDAMQRWADDELRSVNAQIEYVLRDALRKSGRARAPEPEPVALEEDAAETADDEPFLVTRPPTGRDDEEEDIFPLKRPPG